MRSGPVVRIGQGVVRGAWHRHGEGAQASPYAVFRGIPYAAAPVGALRFAAPAAPATWEGEREASAFGPTPQRRSPYDPPRIPEPSIPGDETLTVNITTPDPGAGACLPVLVWIHGGGFVGGSPASPWYVGGAFARDGVVTVTFGYRLGFEGFGWIDDAPANRGVRDWLAALAWVQDNIGAFGGDPARVTIAGQSAGGAAVMRLLSMPAAQGLFSGALAISPADASSKADATRAASTRIAASLGAGLRREELERLSELDLFEARDLALQAPMGQVEGLFHRESTPVALGPCVDGELITASVRAGLAAGVGADVPLLLGACAHEFNQFGDPSQVDGLTAEEAVIRAGVPAGLAGDCAAREPDRGAAWAVGQLISDAIFRAPVAGFLRERVATGAPTWAYDFRWESTAPGMFGAAHCLDVPFGFDILDEAGVDAVTGTPPAGLGEAVHGDWLALVAAGKVGAPQYGGGRESIVYTAEGQRRIAPAFGLEERLWDAARGADLPE